MIEMQHKDATVRLGERIGGKRRLTVEPRDPGVYIHRSTWDTEYPDSLVRLIMEVKSPAFLCDELMRHEDPRYIRRHLELTIAAHVDPAALDGKRVLDFGCGAGASTIILAQLLPRSSLLGVDLNPGNLQIARARAELYGMSQVQFLQSPGGDSLPSGLGPFDAIVLSAVYEHLLPHERRTLMPMLWDLLVPGGVLFLDETPARWFPVETHTTGLPLLNYLPDWLAAACARRCSRRVSRTDSWETLCRNGVRGASEREVLRTLSGSPVAPRRISPHRLGIGNPVDLWYRGYAEAEPGARGSLKRGARHVLRAASAILGTPMVPYLSLAIRKGPSA